MIKKKEEEQVKNKKVYKGSNLFAGVIVGMFVCITVYLIYNLSKLSGIEDLIRYIVMIALGLVSIFVVFRYFRFKKNAKVGKYIMFILVLAIIGTGEFFVSSTISKSVSFIDKLNKDEVTYKSSLIALKAGDYNTLNKAKEFGKIIYGYGNNGKNEGARNKNLLFTNALGPVLVKNPWLTEYLINLALKNKGLKEINKKIDFDLELKSLESAKDFINKKIEKERGNE